EASGEDTLLDGHEQVVLCGQLGGEARIDRLREAGVGDGHGGPALGEDLGGFERLTDAGSVAEQRDARARGRRGAALAEDLTGSDLDQLRALGQRHAGALAARV